MAKKQTLARRVGRRTVEIANPEKILFPVAKITKLELVDYYDAVAEWMLPWLRDRALVLQRFPDGIAAEGFFQKQASEYFPDWIERVRVKKEGGSQELVVCNDRATLVYLANQASITLHTWLSRTHAIGRPDMLVIDLDPAGGRFERVRDAARWCRDLLEELGLVAFAKTTGSKGVHVVVPLDGKHDFDSVRELARDAVRLLAARHANVLTIEQRRAKRGERVYLDVGRNAYAQTAVAPYSVRAIEGAPVAMPISWRELDDPHLDARSFTLRDVPGLLATRRDPWAGMRRRARSLAAARRRLDRLAACG